MHHPMRGNEAYKDENINFDRYLEYMHGQVEELVTNYGSWIFSGLISLMTTCVKIHGKQKS